MEGRIAYFTPIIDMILRVAGAVSLVAIAGFAIWFWWPFS